MHRPFLSRSLPLAAAALLLGVVAASTTASAREARNRRVPARWTPAGLRPQDTIAVYTEAQAARGKEVFTAVCAECHEVEDLTNDDFRQNWDGTTLYELFDNIRTTMPDENPGTLPPQQYVDVTAYLLQLNKLPAGEVEFTGDSASASAVRLPLLPKP
jgi:mono/diheme cytochrome c family protein